MRVLNTLDTKESEGYMHCPPSFLTRDKPHLGFISLAQFADFKEQGSKPGSYLSLHHALHEKSPGSAQSVSPWERESSTGVVALSTSVPLASRSQLRPPYPNEVIPETQDELTEPSRNHGHLRQCQRIWVPVKEESDNIFIQRSQIPGYWWWLHFLHLTREVLSHSQIEGRRAQNQNEMLNKDPRNPWTR